MHHARLARQVLAVLRCSSTIAHTRLNCLVLDGVYRRSADGRPVFVEVDGPTDDELHALLQTLSTRPMKLLRRRGGLVVDMAQTCLAEPDADGHDEHTTRPLQAASVRY